MNPNTKDLSSGLDAGEFTPGPWRAYAHVPIVTRDKTASYPADPTGNVEICRVGNWADKELRPYNGDRWMADARLIAAAPDLLEALQVFAAIVPSSLHPADGSEAEAYVIMLHDPTMLGQGGKPDFTGADLARARAALAKVSPPMILEPSVVGE